MCSWRSIAVTSCTTKASPALVTTGNGSLELLNVLGERAPSREEYEPYPAIVVSQIPERIEDWKIPYDRLIEGRAKFLPTESDATEDPLILGSDFDQALQV